VNRLNTEITPGLKTTLAGLHGTLTTADGMLKNTNATLVGTDAPAALWKELCAQGYPGTVRMIERYVLRFGQRLKGLTPQESAQFLQVATTFKTPAVRQVTT
jgi:hypothetical protein